MSENPNNPQREGGPLASTPQPTSGRAGDVIEDVASTLRDLFTKAPETLTKAVEKALNVKDTTVLLRLSEASSDSLDNLVSAGVFKSRGEAAAFLIDEGIKSQSSLFQKIQDKMSEIERLRAELRESVK